MANDVLIKALLASPADHVGQPVRLTGWVRTARVSKSLAFVELNDGSCFENLQVVVTEENAHLHGTVDGVTLGSTVAITGEFVESAGAKQPYEVHATEIEIVGMAAPEYPIQKKRHTLEYLRTISHLRPRTNTYLATFRVRSLIAMAIHRFFDERGFVYVHTPIVSDSDAEGAGEMFHVSTLDLKNLPRTDDGRVDFGRELLGKETFLTVSGQLAVEAFCLAFRNVYTFGPAFRAENSNTPRHANEFWMIEPEIAFADLEEDMRLAEAMMKYLVEDLFQRAPAEMAFFDRFIEKGLIARLERLAAADFEIITYTEAIERLGKSGKSFEFPTDWGVPLQTEHERYLTDEVFEKPVFVTDYPRDAKAFYMRLNDDEKTVRAMDLLVPGVGEIIGGSQREERLDVLEAQIRHHGVEAEEYAFYTELRRFGTFPHAGYGLGFERAIMYLTGMKNIRDVIPFPRTPGQVM